MRLPRLPLVTALALLFFFAYITFVSDSFTAIRCTFRNYFSLLRFNF